MKQTAFASAAWEKKGKVTRRERLRIPRHVGPLFHVMPGRDSTACRATVPR
jgi:hypothetical protein